MSFFFGLSGAKGGAISVTVSLTLSCTVLLKDTVNSSVTTQPCSDTEYSMDFSSVRVQSPDILYRDRFGRQFQGRQLLGMEHFLEVVPHADKPGWFHVLRKQTVEMIVLRIQL